MTKPTLIRICATSAHYGAIVNSLKTDQRFAGMDFEHIQDDEFETMNYKDEINYINGRIDRIIYWAFECPFAYCSGGVLTV